MPVYLDEYTVGTLSMKRGGYEPVKLIDGVTQGQALLLMQGLEQWHQLDYGPLYDPEGMPAFAEGWEVVWSAHGRRFMMDMDSWVEIK